MYEACPAYAIKRVQRMPSSVLCYVLQSKHIATIVYDSFHILIVLLEVETKKSATASFHYRLNSWKCCQNESVSEAVIVLKTCSTKILD